MLNASWFTDLGNSAAAGQRGYAPVRPDHARNGKLPNASSVVVVVGRGWRQDVTLTLLWPRLPTSRWDDAH